MITTKLLFISLFIYIISAILLFHYDPTGHFNIGSASTVSLTFFGIIVLIMLIIMGLKNKISNGVNGVTSSNLWSILKTTIVIIGGLLVFIGIIFLIFHFMKNPPVSKGIFTILNIIIFSLTVLLLLYFIKDLTFTNPYILLIKNVIMYIPCLIYQLIGEIKYQYSITTPISVIILGADIVFILLNIIWNKAHSFYKRKKSKDGLLLEGPVYINKNTTLGTFEDMKPTTDNVNYSYHYAISFDVYINAQPPNTNIAYSSYTTLFDYGGKPTLLYKADENKFKIQVKMSDYEIKTIYIGSDLKLQKWNKFLINYDRGTLDIFLNDDLISSVGSISPYMYLDIVSVGQNEGINGGIRNVVYFRNTVI